MTLVGDHRRRNMSRRAVTAAARALPVRPDGRIDWPVGLKVEDKRLWGYYRSVDVVHFGMGFKRNAALRAKFFPAIRTDDPNAEPEAIPLEKRDADMGIAVDVFQRLDGGRGRIAEALGDLIIHLDVVGVGFPVYQLRPDPDLEDGLEDRLTVYSTIEVRRQSNGLLHRVDERGNPEAGKWQISRDDLAAHVWRPSPERRADPDSPLRAVADECDLLLQIAGMFQASMLSRINNGLIVLDNSLRPIPPPIQEEGEERKPDPFLNDMVTAFGAPIAQPNHPSRYTPYFLFGDNINETKIQKVDLGRTITPQDLELLEIIQGRVATGIDLPPELITGLAQMNHWGTWYIDAAAYRQHVDPPLLLGMDGLTRYIYWPLLRKAGIEDPSRFVIWRDISALTASANRVADAVALWDRGLIKGEAVRAVAGYDETDAVDGDPEPGPGSKKADVDSQQDPNRPEGPPASDSPTGEDTEGTEAVAAGYIAPAWATVASIVADRHPNTPAGREAAVLELRALMRGEEPPAPVIAADGRMSGRSLTTIDMGLTARLATAALAAQKRALSRAGARIRNKTRKDATVAAMIDGLANENVTLRLGRNLVEGRLAIAAADLVSEDDFDGLATDARGMLDRGIQAAAREVETLTDEEPARDADEEQAAVDAAVGILVAAVLAATLRRLYTPGPESDPASTGEVPDAHAISGRTLLDVTTTAGGGVAGVIPDGNGFDVGIGNGPRTVTQLRAANVVTVANKWVYGDRSARGVNFESHLILDGIEFDRWDDPALANYGTFPPTGRLHPGDHGGCLCSYERVLWRL